MRHPLALALLLTAAPLALADEPKPRDAEKATAEGLDALQKADWQAYARLLHPDSLKSFRDVVVPALVAADKAGKADKDLLALFGDAKDVEAVKKWTPSEVFVKTMTSLTRVETTRAMFSTRRSRVIGSVPEGDGQRHVVVRVTQKAGEVELKRVEVVTARLHGGKWTLQADDFVSGLAEGVKQTCEIHKPR